MERAHNGAMDGSQFSTLFVHYSYILGELFVLLLVTSTNEKCSERQMETNSVADEPLWAPWL